jgi:hypothetical protein
VAEKVSYGGAAPGARAGKFRPHPGVALSLKSDLLLRAPVVIVGRRQLLAVWHLDHPGSRHKRVRFGSIPLHCDCLALF